MADVVRWYAALLLLGLASLPLTVWLLGRLPSRGYAFARPLGLLFSAYALWLGASFGVLDNQPATALLVVLALGAFAWTRRGPVRELGALWRTRPRLVVGVEALFLLSFLGWCLFRAFVPEIASTEKPMEFAFLNGILRSQRFPPADPWLSGFSISYYYLGYVMTALLTEVSRVPSSVAFNLMIATLFALTATGAFSVGYDLVPGLEERRAAAESPSAPEQSRAPARAGCLAALLTLALANWEGFLELLHAWGVGSAGFWTWIGVKDLSHPYVSATGLPSDLQDMWWWFRASRVVATAGPNGAPRDYTINEFPSFSFILGDLHPHVLALPFTLLALAFALNLLRSSGPSWSWSGDTPELPSWLGWARPSRLLTFLLSNLLLRPIEALRRSPAETLAVGVVFGGLGFLNAWDLPTYLFVLVGAYALRQYLARPALDAAWRREVLGFAWVALLTSVVLYLPFYVGFRSQTAGLGVVEYRTQLRHLALFWGPLLLVVGPFLLLQIRRSVVPLGGKLAPEPSDGDWASGSVWRATLAISAALLLIELPPIRSFLPDWAQAPSLAVLLPLLVASAALIRRYLGIGGPATDDEEAKAGPEVAGGAVPASLVPEHVFVLFLAFTGLLLISGTEFLFVRDLFNNRMNTVFKLYYQAWTLLAVAAAYGLYYLTWLRRPEAPAAARTWAGIWLRVAAVGLAVGLVYLPCAVLSRASAASGSSTLDGTQFLARTAPADYAAIQWLSANVAGNPVVLEAPGGSYSEFGRVSADTGLPTLLGWYAHETQWRGNDVAQRQRQADVDLIYRTTDRQTALDLLQRYGVTYVYVGPLEVRQYGQSDPAGLAKFGVMLDTVYQRGGVTIYRTVLAR